MNRKPEPPPNPGEGTVEAPQNRITIPIKVVADIVTARQHGRELAARSGFSETESTLIATIISELARNIVLYAEIGEIVLEKANSGDKDRKSVV